MAKILVTGGAGYIGSVLVPALLQEKHEVVVVDNFMYQQSSLLDVCHDARLSIVRGDARDERTMALLMKSTDYIFPLACITGAPACQKDPSAAEEINLGAVRLILKLRAKEQRIIFPTTNSGYGVGREGILCDEKTPLNPISLYGKLKVEAEKKILEAGNSVTLRLATAFGVSPRMRLDLLVNDFVYRAVNERSLILFEGHFKRNYIHVRDISRAFLHVLGNFDRMQNEPFNAGLSGCNLSKRELCDEIKKHVPEFCYTESDVGKDPDQRNYIISNKKIEKTGFHAEYPLEFGIRELIKGYQIINARNAAMLKNA